jgi:hypothetical protein
MCDPSVVIISVGHLDEIEVDFLEWDIGASLWMP